MEIIQVAGIALVATTLILVLKNQRPELSIQISIIAGVIIIGLLLGKLKAVLAFLESYTINAKIGQMYIKSLFKIVGITYIAQFASEICKDADQSAVASKIEFAAKILILVIAVPIVTSVLDLLVGLI